MTLALPCGDDDPEMNAGAPTDDGWDKPAEETDEKEEEPADG